MSSLIFLHKCFLENTYTARGELFYYIPTEQQHMSSLAVLASSLSPDHHVPVRRRDLAPVGQQSRVEELKAVDTDHCYSVHKPVWLLPSFRSLEASRASLLPTAQREQGCDRSVQ